MNYSEKDFGKLIKHNAQDLRHEFLPQGTNCFRVYDRNMEMYPVTVDLYDKYARVVDFGETPLSEENKEIVLNACSRMLYLDRENVIYSYRAKVGKDQHEKSENVAVKTTVLENNLKFTVDLTSYADTGLFLDHMKTRLLVKERSEGADVLNLFSYTGSFSVYAASGLAKSVTSVDLSSTYTKWAEENLRNNGFEGPNYMCICEDAIKFIHRAQNEGKKYDIIIFDPPSFSNSHKMDSDFDLSRDWAYYIKQLTLILNKSGFIMFSNNLGSFSMDKRRLRGLSVQDITAQVKAPGFLKGRKGTVRSWIMKFDDSSLSLDWSEDAKKEENREERRPRGERRESSYGKREYHGRDDRRNSSYGRERRSDDNRRSSYSRDRRSSYGSRENREEGYSRREYGDREERSTERRSYGHRDYDRSERSDRRSSYGNREYHGRTSYYSKDRSDRSERSPRREYSSRDSRDSRPRREKPYGYDSFRKARSRDDSSDFFWNSDEK